MRGRRRRRLTCSRSFSLTSEQTCRPSSWQRPAGGALLLAAPVGCNITVSRHRGTDTDRQRRHCASVPYGHTGSRVPLGNGDEVCTLTHRLRIRSSRHHLREDCGSRYHAFLRHLTSRSQRRLQAELALHASRAAHAAGRAALKYGSWTETWRTIYFGSGRRSSTNTVRLLRGTIAGYHQVPSRRTITATTIRRPTGPGDGKYSNLPTAKTSDNTGQRTRRDTAGDSQQGGTQVHRHADTQTLGSQSETASPNRQIWTRVLET